MRISKYINKIKTAINSIYGTSNKYNPTISEHTFNWKSPTITATHDVNGNSITKKYKYGIEINGDFLSIYLINYTDNIIFHIGSYDIDSNKMRCLFSDIDILNTIKYINDNQNSDTYSIRIFPKTYNILNYEIDRFSINLLDKHIDLNIYIPISILKDCDTPHDL